MSKTLPERISYLTSQNQGEIKIALLKQSTSIRKNGEEATPFHMHAMHMMGYVSCMGVLCILRAWGK